MPVVPNTPPSEGLPNGGSDINITTTLSVFMPFTRPWEQSVPTASGVIGGLVGNYAFSKYATKECLQNTPDGNIVKIPSLDTIFALDCIPAVPVLKFSPDQRDTLLPVVTPKVANPVYNLGCIPVKSGQTNAPALSELGPAMTLGSVNSVTARTDQWTRPDSTGVSISRTATVVSRVAFSDGVGAEAGLFAFYRKYSYDSCGMLVSVSPETKFKLSDASLCS
jgi:hypothetical protein